MPASEDEIASLLESLTDADKRTIRRAADRLIAIASDYPSLGERLNQLANQIPIQARWPIAYVLAHTSPLSSACLDILKETLGNNDPDIRWAIALLLVRLAKQYQAAATLLFDLRKSGDPTQRRMALYCLRDLDLKDAVSLRALQESLSDSDPLVRVAALTSLKSRSDIERDGTDRVLHLLWQDPDSRVRHTAAIVLAGWGGLSEKIQPALELASRSEDLQLKKAANAALDLLKKKRPAP